MDQRPALEDVSCLVFLKYESARIHRKDDDAKVRDILARRRRNVAAGIAEPPNWSSIRVWRGC